MKVCLCLLNKGLSLDTLKENGRVFIVQNSEKCRFVAVDKLTVSAHDLDSEPPFTFHFDHEHVRVMLSIAVGRWRSIICDVTGADLHASALSPYVHFNP